MELEGGGGEPEAAARLPHGHQVHREAAAQSRMQGKWQMLNCDAEVGRAEGVGEEADAAGVQRPHRRPPAQSLSSQWVSQGEWAGDPEVAMVKGREARSPRQATLRPTRPTSRRQTRREAASSSTSKNQSQTTQINSKMLREATDSQPGRRTPVGRKEAVVVDEKLVVNHLRADVLFKVSRLSLALLDSGQAR